jgi:two-component system response regulator GlrR
VAPLEELFCPATAPELQGRALFGSVSDASAGPGESTLGAFERVATGTLVLEGVEALATEPHARLLRALAERSFRREGESEGRPLRARLVAIAEQPSERAVFGEVPYHEIGLASLRERSEEILPLASHFLAVFAREAGVKAVGFTREARAALLEETWPGNLTELRERIRHAVHLSQDGAISAEALLLAPENAQIPSFREAKRAFEARYVTGLLRRCGGNVSQAARLARKDRKDFYDVIRRTGVRPADFRP